MAACSDQWAKQIATDLVLGRTDLPYIQVQHFKETDGDGKAKHREIYLPGANEALAEAALLDACAKYRVFNNPECVFSYRLNSGSDRKGIFVPYSEGLCIRQDSIASACDDNAGGVVKYVDIKKFYPSISPKAASTAWAKFTNESKLPSHFREVGEKLLDDHKKVSDSILTGPMFSHMIGNLILRELDEHCTQSLPVKYFRYVDDITLIGSADAVVTATNEIRSRLESIGLTLHENDSPKTVMVSSSEWVVARNDFRETHRENSWPSLIHELKNYLMLNPEGRDTLSQAFQDSGIRIPVFDYSNAILEGNYLERVADLGKRLWYRRKSQKANIESMLTKARALRARFREEFLVLSDEVRTANPFQKKCLIPKLRYRAGRLVYLSTDDVLGDLAKAAWEIPELHFYSHVMSAVATGNLDEVLSIGTNAAQAAAQPLRAAGKVGNLSRQNLSDVEDQSLAVLMINGVEVKQPENAIRERTGLMIVAETGSTAALMRQSSEPFIREIACLHGITGVARHPEVLESVFDRDEELAMDAIDQLQQSVSP